MASGDDDWKYEALRKRRADLLRTRTEAEIEEAEEKLEQIRKRREEAAKSPLEKALDKYLEDQANPGTPDNPRAVRQEPAEELAKKGVDAYERSELKEKVDKLESEGKFSEARELMAVYKDKQELNITRDPVSELGKTRLDPGTRGAMEITEYFKRWQKDTNILSGNPPAQGGTGSQWSFMARYREPFYAKGKKVLMPDGSPSYRYMETLGRTGGEGLVFQMPPNNPAEADFWNGADWQPLKPKEGATVRIIVSEEPAKVKGKIQFDDSSARANGEIIGSAGRFDEEGPANSPTRAGVGLPKEETSTRVGVGNGKIGYYKRSQRPYLKPGLKLRTAFIQKKRPNFREQLEPTARHALVLQDVSKFYGGREGHSGGNFARAVRNVSFTVDRGEFVAITGPSGSGKSTLLNLMGCLDVPSEGRVFILGEPVDKKGDGYLSGLRAAKIGFVFQSFNLIPRLSALQNVMLPMSLAGSRSGQEKRARATELLADVGLAGKEGKFPRELSGGEMQRVAIARALANEPQIILADEPTGNLDSIAGRQVIDALEELNARKGVTLVLVTHDDSLAKEASVRVRMKDGKLEEVIRESRVPAPAQEELEVLAGLGTGRFQREEAQAQVDAHIDGYSSGGGGGNRDDDARVQLPGVLRQSVQRGVLRERLLDTARYNLRRLSAFGERALHLPYPDILSAGRQQHKRA
jgi:ABC-type lipoprotein export system ATPase subunit